MLFVSSKLSSSTVASSLLTSAGIADRTSRDSALNRKTFDPLSRNVYGIMGIPVDAACLPSVVNRLKCAVSSRKIFVLSTPNLNFLVMSRSDPDFRESLLMSDLCPADGTPLVWLGRLLGVPLSGRVAGSDIFDAIRIDRSADKPMKVFLFGGADGLGKSVADKINAFAGSMRCVGAICPGFGTVEQLSTPELIQEINSSNADFVVAFLGAKKGQDWLVHNHANLKVPIRAHLGATINYQAGTVRRAPGIFQKWGLEWLWRIKEEPYLWRRYLNDGSALLRIVLTAVVPLLVYKAVSERVGSKGSRVEITMRDEHGETVLAIAGSAVAETIEQIVPYFRRALAGNRNMVVDLSDTTSVDARLFGALIMLRKCLLEKGAKLRLTCRNRRLRWIIGLHGFNYLLDMK